MQFGPTMRIPEPRTSSVSRSCASRPPADTSAKPAEITTTPRTPARAQSCDGALDGGRRDGDHRQVDRRADRAAPSGSAQAPDLVGAAG